MRYWTRPVHLKYEVGRKLDHALLWLAGHMPGRLRLWVVVCATNDARRLYPDPTGYAGPDGLGYKEIYDGARRMKP